MDSHMWSLFKTIRHAKVLQLHESIHIRPKLLAAPGIQWMPMSLWLPVKMALLGYMTLQANKLSQSKLSKDISRKFIPYSIVQIWETSLLHVVMIERSESGGLTVIQIQCPSAAAKVWIKAILRTCEPCPSSLTFHSVCCLAPGTPQ